MVIAKDKQLSKTRKIIIPKDANSSDGNSLLDAYYQDIAKQKEKNK